ncbi:MAG TPA: hypothetical protein VFH73_23010, partial [Polyangia bacterium]|nr:hypothetical protein [Polyangia bacterium]
MAAGDGTADLAEAQGAYSTDENGLSSINGLSSVNGLSSINGLSSVNGLMTSFDGRLNVKYLVKCALPAGHQLKKQDQFGVWNTFDGAMGMGTGWENGACDKNCQEGISACMMAHVNTAGVHIPLWMVSPAANVGWGTSGSYPNREGTYFGNIFPSNPKAYYCNGPNYATSAAP